MEKLDRLRIGMQGKDPEITGWFERTEKLRTNMASLVAAVQVFEDLNQKAGKAWLDIMTIIQDTYSFYNPDEEIMSEIRDALAATRIISQRTNLNGPINSRVNKWIANLGTIKECVDQSEKTRIEYLHYEKKLQSLRADREKRRQQGKQDSAKQHEELIRNETKLGKSTAEYEAAKALAVKRSTDALNQRYMELDPLTITYLEAQKDYYTQIQDSIKSLDSTIEKLKAISSKRPTGDDDLATPTKGKSTPAPASDDEGFDPFASGTKGRPKAREDTMSQSSSGSSKPSSHMKKPKKVASSSEEFDPFAASGTPVSAPTAPKSTPPHPLPVDDGMWFQPQTDQTQSTEPAEFDPFEQTAKPTASTSSVAPPSTKKSGGDFDPFSAPTSSKPAPKADDPFAFLF